MTDAGPQQTNKQGPLGDLQLVSAAQYQVVAARQQHFNTLSWQVPPLSATAQSFLLVPAFNPNVSNVVAALTGLLDCLVAACSIHLFVRHSRNELADSVLLERIEQANGWPLLHTAAAKRSLALGSSHNEYEPDWSGQWASAS